MSKKLLEDPAVKALVVKHVTMAKADAEKARKALGKIIARKVVAHLAEGAQDPALGGDKAAARHIKAMASRLKTEIGALI